MRRCDAPVRWEWEGLLVSVGVSTHCSSEAWGLRCWEVDKRSHGVTWATHILRGKLQVRTVVTAVEAAMVAGMVERGSQAAQEVAVVELGAAAVVTAVETVAAMAAATAVGEMVVETVAGAV